MQNRENRPVLPVTVDVEYCGVCNGYRAKFEEMSQVVLQHVPAAHIVGRTGRPGSFEVTINGYLIHSKCSTMAFPDFVDVASCVLDAKNGKPLQFPKQDPITDCAIF